MADCPVGPGEVDPEEVYVVILIGLLLLAAAAVAGIELVLANRDTVTVRMWNASWNVEAFWLAAAGAALLLVALIGLAALRLGAARRRRLRRRQRELAEENRVLAERARRAEVADEAGDRDLADREADRGYPGDYRDDRGDYRDDLGADGTADDDILRGDRAGRAASHRR